MPSRTHLAAVAVTSTSVRPRRTVTAPSAWRARRPVSRVISFSGAPLRMVALTLMVSAIVRLLSGAGCCRPSRGGRGGQFPGLAVRADDGPGGGSWQLTLPASVLRLSVLGGFRTVGPTWPGRERAAPRAASW